MSIEDCPVRAPFAHEKFVASLELVKLQLFDPGVSLSDSQILLDKHPFCPETAIGTVGSWRRAMMLEKPQECRSCAKMQAEKRKVRTMRET
jgi:hypothetical protein